MISEILNMNGYGLYVWSSFMFTLLSFGTLYFVTKIQFVKEQKKFVGRGGGPGAITFYNQCTQDYFIGSNIIKPETGDFFIFPAMLCHSVASFKSNVERVSIAANFSFKGGKFETESN